MRQLVAMAEKYSPLQERLESCLIELKDIITELKKEACEITTDPAKLEEARAQLNTIYRLQQKHQTQTIEALLTIQSENVADCTKAAALMAGFTAEHLLADRGYDTHRVIAQGKAQRMKVVIPPRQICKTLCSYDKSWYKLRHLIENVFLHLKGWRGIATRYAKKVHSFLAAIQIRCVAFWDFL